MAKKSLRVCYFGTYRANYARNQIMMAGLRAVGVEVIECHVPLWTGIEDRVQAASGQWARWSFLKRVVSTYTKLLWQYIALPKNYDIIVLGYPGQIDVFLAWILAKLGKKPLVMDMLMSIYLVAWERNLIEANPLTGHLIKRLERWGSSLPDLLIFNTNAYIAWYQKTYNLASGNFALVPMGVDDTIFKAIEAEPGQDSHFSVLYYGTFIQNHGVECIIEAANLLRDKKEIQFELVGNGPTRVLVERLANQYQLENVIFTDWVEKEQLPHKIATADLCLGVFSLTTQSQITIHNKIYEALAMEKPIITGDSPTIRETFVHGTHLFLVERNNPRLLAEAVLTLRDDAALRTRLAEAGHRKVMAEFTIAALGHRLRHYLEDLSFRD